MNPLKIPLYIIKACEQRAELMIIFFSRGRLPCGDETSSRSRPFCAIGARDFPDRLYIFIGLALLAQVNLHHPGREYLYSLYQ